MTEARFDELINLYLDNEIGRSDQGELKHEITNNLVRRRKFERACQLHQAARKALANPASGESAGAPAANLRVKGGNRHAPPPRASHGTARDSSKNKQGRAHLNASVSVLADRQNRQGSASSVELSKIDIESSVGKRRDAAGSSRNYSFFDSPLGVIAGIVLTLLGAFGMYFVIRTVSPDSSDDPGKFSENSPITLLDGGYDPKAAEELTAEIKRKQALATASDAMRTRLNQSALTGPEAGNTTPVDYFASHSDNPSASTLSGNAIADLQPTVEPAAAVTPAKAADTTAPSATQP